MAPKDILGRDEAHLVVNTGRTLPAYLDAKIGADSGVRPLVSGVTVRSSNFGVPRLITFNDARKGVRELDLTDEEATQLGGRPVARRGRRPKGQSSSQ